MSLYIGSNEVSVYSGLPASVNLNVQPDWNQTDEDASDYIQNKPFGNLVTVSNDTEIWTSENNGCDSDENDEWYFNVYVNVVHGVTYTLTVTSRNMGITNIYTGTFIDGELYFSPIDSDEIVFRAKLEEGPGRTIMAGLYGSKDTIIELSNDSSASIHLSYDSQVLSKLTFDNIEMAHEVESMDPKPVSGAAVHEYVDQKLRELDTSLSVTDDGAGNVTITLG